MEEAERAITALFDPSTPPGVKEEASAYCTNLQQSAGAWRLACELLLSTQTQEVKFWSLQTLQEFLQHRYAVLQEEECKQIQKFLFSWVVEVNPQAANPPFILNKVAQLYAILLRNEYPEAWPDGIKGLLPALNIGLPVVDMFLRIMGAIDAEIINHEFHRSPQDLAVSTRVKDAMREECLTQIIEAFYQILLMCHEREEKIANSCLNTLSKYIHWIDINLVVNEQMLTAFFTLLPSDHFVEQTFVCLTEIVLKKMEAAPKVRLISTLLGSREAIQGQLELREGRSEAEGPMVRISQFISAVCKELMLCGDKLKGSNTPEEGQAGEGLRLLFPLLIRCAANPIDDVSHATIDFLTGYVNMLKKKESIDPQYLEQLEPILGVLHRKVQYDIDFDFENLGEQEETFLDYRREINIVFKNIARIAPEITMRVVQSKVEELAASLETASFAGIEGVLNLIYELGEVMRIDLELQHQGPLSRILSTALASGICSHPHPAVQRTYMELISRYSRFLVMNPSYIPGFFTSFLQTISGGAPVTRSRACYLLLKVMRTIRPGVAPYAEGIMGALTPLLHTEQNPLDHQDKLYLFETAGSVVGSESLANETKTLYFNQILMPMMNRIDVVTQDLSSSESQNEIGIKLECIGWLSKGCQRLCDQQGEILMKVLDLSIKAISSNPSSTKLRSSTLVFYHRMVECLGLRMMQPTSLQDPGSGQNALPQALKGMLVNGDVKAISDVVTLVNQMISKFKENSSNFMINLTPQVCESALGALEGLAPILNDFASQEAREVRDLYKIWLQLLQSASHANALGIFVTEQASGYLQRVVGSVIQGLTVLEEPSTCKVCVFVVVKMANSWAPTPSAPQPLSPSAPQPSGLTGFKEFILPTVAKAVIQCSLRPSVDANDAQWHSLLSELASTQRKFRGFYGGDWEQALTQQLLGFGLQPPQCQEYIWNLKEGSDSLFREFFIGQMQRLRDLRNSNPSAS